MRAHLIAVIVTASPAGCGGDFSGLEGIYTIDTWTLNNGACDAEGPSVAATREPMFYIKTENFFGTEFLNVSLCDDLPTCEADAADDGTINLGGWGFESGNDADGWTETSEFAFEMDGTCTGSVSVTTMTSPAASAIRIESRYRDTVPFPATDGDCPDDDTLAAAEGQPCTRLEVTTATFTQGI